MSKSIIEVNSSNFEHEVLNSDKPVLVDFWAAWCTPCRMVAPVMEQIAGEYAGKLKVAKVNVDENSELSNRYRVMSIPSIFLFKEGKQVDGIVGVRPKQHFDEMIKKHI